MIYYSGFSLQNEQSFFKDFLDTSAYSVAGFSYGAIKAFHHVVEQLENSQRVERLQLFSPAFFQTKDAKFHRLQLMAYKKNSEKYMEEFILGCFAPYSAKKVEHIPTSVEELKELLAFEWPLERLRYIHSEGVKIEVYLGGQDKIIESAAARDFFLEIATITYIKDANHFLQLN
jgi:hypothetical protein